MIRIAICDDDTKQLHDIKSMCERCLRNHTEEIRYTLYDSSFLLSEELERGRVFDIFLLDITMPGISGLDIAAEIRRKKLHGEIIFLTSSDEFAIEAFSLQTIHYLIKPIKEKELDIALGRAFEKIKTDRETRIVFKTSGGGLQIEDIDNISFIESRGHILTVYLKDGSFITTRRTLAGLQKMLDEIMPHQFISPGKGYIVNQKAIHIIKPGHIEIKGHIIPIAQRKFRKLQENYFNFMLQKGIGGRQV